MKRIGFDIDGVLANFTGEFRKILIEVSHRDLFHTHNDMGYSPVNEWAKVWGYTENEIDKAWEHIYNLHNFFGILPKLDGVRALRALSSEIDVYCITNRGSSLSMRRQTEYWVRNAINIHPTNTLISRNKILTCQALELDAYIDDSRDYLCKSHSPYTPFNTHLYLLDSPYNQGNSPIFMRVNSVTEMLEIEGLK